MEACRCLRLGAIVLVLQVGYILAPYCLFQAAVLYFYLLGNVHREIQFNV